MPVSPRAETLAGFSVLFWRRESLPLATPKTENIRPEPCSCVLSYTRPFVRTKEEQTREQGFKACLADADLRTHTAPSLRATIKDAVSSTWPPIA